MVYMDSILALKDIIFTCPLPPNCRIDRLDLTLDDYSESRTSFSKVSGIRCDLNEPKYEFTFRSTNKTKFSLCVFEVLNYWPSIELRFNDQSRMIDKMFNVTNLLVYLNRLPNSNYIINVINMKGFELSLWNDDISFKSVVRKIKPISYIDIKMCDFDFYLNGKLMKSCEDLLSNNLSFTASILQIDLLSIDQSSMIGLHNCKFKREICPLVFNRTSVNGVIIKGLSNTFYKENTLRFSNSSLELDVIIYHLSLIHVENIEISSKMLNTQVFKRLIKLEILGFVDRIDGDCLNELNLSEVSFESVHFRKLVHKNGIDWIRRLNADLNVNLSNKSDVRRYINKSRLISLNCDVIFTEGIRMSRVFPDEDFCLYVEFPFHQMIFLAQVCDWFDDRFDLTVHSYSITYIWLIQYLSIVKTLPNVYLTDPIEQILQMNEFKSVLNGSEFKTRIKLCNRSNFTTNEIISVSDVFILNKKLQIAINISNLTISLLGIVANILVIITVYETKQTQQYIYLSMNSITNIVILCIEMLSWMNECIYPYQVFCPKIRKLIAIQLFKIVFKELIATVFRFMSNFTYMAFAFSRIALLDKNHGKLVGFFSNAGIKSYLGVTLAISLSFSWIKFFRFEINYDLGDMEYPIPNEVDIFRMIYVDFSSLYNVKWRDAFFIINSICDLVNNVVFVFLGFFVDLGLVVSLRRVLNEQLATYEKITEQSEKVQKRKKENENAVRKTVKMVVINTTIGIILKSPGAILPVLNLAANYFYKDEFNRVRNPSFAEFYFVFTKAGFQWLLNDLCDFLFHVSISIQIFVFYRFDKRFKEWFDKKFICGKTTERKNVK